MEKLFRMGHQPALTLGNAKTVDILTKSSAGNLYQVSVKAVQKAGKWGVGVTDYSKEKNLIFVFLYFRQFENLELSPETWVIPANIVEKIKLPWLGGASAVYFSNEMQREIISKYKDAWHLFK